MLSLNIRRIAEIRTVFWEPASDDDHLVSVDNVCSATSVWVLVGPVVSRKRLDPRKGWNREDVSIVVSERISKTISTVQITM